MRIEFLRICCRDWLASRVLIISLLTISLLVISLVTSPVSLAQAPVDLPWAQGSIKKLDAGNGKITLQHGPIDNLGMSGMTMGFRLHPQAQAQAAGLAVGDTIEFQVIESEGKYVVMAIRKRP